MPKPYIPDEDDFEDIVGGAKTDRLVCDYCRCEILPGQKFFLYIDEITGDDSPTNYFYDKKECALADFDTHDEIEDMLQERVLARRKD